MLLLKQDCELYASLYVACQTRESGLSDFFSHENYSYPPDLSKFGKLNHTNKFDAISILKKLGPSEQNVPEFFNSSTEVFLALSNPADSVLSDNSISVIYLSNVWQNNFYFKFK